MSGSISSQRPPASPQPILGMCTEAPKPQPGRHGTLVPLTASGPLDQ
jgi:hypothetical protein